MLREEEPTSPVLGIIVGGGPAPGLNSVIAAAVTYACRLHWTVIGFHDGYKHLSSANEQAIKDNSVNLTMELVASYQSLGGSLLRCDRMDPTKDPKHVSNVIRMLSHFKVRYLLAIGGNDKIMTSHILTQGVDPKEMQIIAVPKTIDNDIQLPVGQTTFGYHTARYFGTKLVRNLINDSSSAPRWFVIETMGRCTGHLAMSIGEASGAHCVIIPEDFGERKISLDDICDVFESAILKRNAIGKPYGVCIISEGLVNQMDDESVKHLYANGFLSLNEHGKIILDDAELSRAIRNEMEKRLSLKKIPIRVNPKKIGYELRCATPVAFDEKYSCELGYGAIEGFRQRHSNCIVIWENGKIFYRSFRSLMDPITGKIAARKVDVTAQSYKVLREYTWQLKKEDLVEPKLSMIAKASNMSPEEFVAKYSRVLELLPAL